MAEELQDPEDENQDDGAQSGEESPIDQSETDEMAQNAPESEANELESLLDDIEEDPDAEVGDNASEADHLENLVDSLEEGEEENLDDTLYQATLQDDEATVEEAEPTSEEETTEDELEALVATFDNVEEPAEEEPQAEAAAETLPVKDLESESEDTEELLEDEDAVATEEEDLEEIDNLFENLEDEADEDTDVGELLEDLDDTSEEEADLTELVEKNADEAEEATAEEPLLEAQDDNTGVLLEDLDESDEDMVDKKAEEAVTVGDLLEDFESDKEAEAEKPEVHSDQDAIEALAGSEEEDTKGDAVDEEVSLVGNTTDEDQVEEDAETGLSDEGAEDVLEENFDLDDLNLDEDTSLEDLNETAETENLEVSAEDELFETNVGVEPEVAHMLATGQPALTEEGDNLFEDFPSIQASLGDDGSEAGRTVLILDNDEDTIGLFQDALVEGDYEFITVGTSDEAIHALQTSQVDIALVNLDAADNHGIVTVDRMTDDDTPPIPIVVTSEHSELIEGALQAGASDYFTIPLGLMDLKYQVPKTVANLITLKRAQRVLTSVESTTHVAEHEDIVSRSSTDLDDLLDNDEDFSFDEDNNLFGDDETSTSSSYLIDDDEDDLPPTAQLAASSDQDRLYPLSDQSKIVREKEWTSTRTTAASKLPIYLGIALMMVILAGLSGMVTMYVIDMKEQDLAEKYAVHRPQPVPVLKPPRLQQAGYEVSSSRIRRPENYQRQAESVKARIRNTVRALDSQAGAWWSPWRVMQQAGGTVGVLVSGRNNDEIINAFGVDRSAVRKGLQSRRSLNYLRGVGYDLSGKDVDDLSPRETFELLSSREIKTQDQIVDVLSRLTDSLATDKAEQANRQNKNRKRQGTARLYKPTLDYGDRVSQATEKIDTSRHKQNLPERIGIAIRMPRVPYSESG